MRLRIVAVADPHMGAPYMPLSRLERVVELANGLGGDLIVLLGDYEAGHRFVSRKVPLADTARVLARLEAPLGVHGILGNHDWWHDREAQARGAGPTEAHRAFAAAGLPVMENLAVRIEGGPAPLWLLGLGDQIAFPGRASAGSTTCRAPWRRSPTTRRRSCWPMSRTSSPRSRSAWR